MNGRLGQMASAATIAVLMFLACDSGGCVDTPTNPCVDPNSAVTSIDLTPLTDSILVGGTTQLTAVARNATGNPIGGQTVTWTSSSDAVATVSASGLVTGQSAGNATFTAQAGTVTSATATVAVFDPVPIASVEVSPPADSVAVGSTIQLTAVALDAAQNPAGGVEITWASSSQAVARVSEFGVVTGQAAGSATITASAGGETGEASVTVLPVPMVVSTSPQDGDSLVAIRNPFLEVTFDRNLDFSSFDESTFFLTGPDGVVPGGFATVDPKKMRFTPDEPLTEFRTEYTLQVTTGVRDAAGVPIAAPVSVTFVTEFVSPDFFYRLWNDALGPDLLLDADLSRDDGQCYHRARGVSTSNALWYFVRVANGFFHMRTNREGDARQLGGGPFGEPCELNPVNPVNNAQRWTFEALGGDRYKVHAELGVESSLDNFKDGRDPEEVYLAPTSDVTSQSWALERSHLR